MSIPWNPRQPRLSMPQQCLLQHVGTFPVCKQPSKYFDHPSGRLFRVCHEHRQSKVDGKVRTKQIRRATDPSFTSIIDNEDTIPYYSSLLAAETNGSTERADHAICDALCNFEDLGGQYNAAAALIRLADRSSNECKWEVEAFILLADNYSGDPFSDVVDLCYAGTDELARELAIMVIANRVVEAQVDVTVAPRPDELRRGMYELKRAAKEYISDEPSVDENAMTFMDILSAYKGAEVAKHMLTPSVIDALAGIVMREDVDDELLVMALGVLSRALCNPALDKRSIASCLVHAGVVEQAQLLVGGEKAYASDNDYTALSSLVLLWHILRSSPLVVLEEKKELLERGVLASFRSAAWSIPWYEEDVIAARLCALNTLLLLTTVFDERHFAEHLVQLGAMQTLLGDCGDACGRDDEPEHSMLCLKNECDERAAVRLLTFLVRHHPRAQEEVVRDIRGRLDDVCNMLGAGQRPDQEAPVLELLNALGPQHCDQIHEQLLTSHAKGTFSHGMCGNPVLWTAWWANVCETLQLDQGQSPRAAA